MRKQVRSALARLPIGTTGGHAALLTVGTAAGHVVTVISLSVLGRSYSQEALAPLVTLQSLGGLLGTVLLLRYEAAIPLAPSDGEARSLVRLCLRLAMLWSVLGLLAVAVAWTAGWIGPDHDLGWSVWALPPLSLAVAWVTVGRQYLGRLGAFGTVSLANVCGILAQAVLHIVGALVGASVVLLGWAVVAGRALNTVMQRRGPRAGDDVEPPLLEVARTWKRMPQWGLVPVVLGGLTVMGLPALIGLLFGAEAVTAYGFTFALLSAPITLLSQAVSGVFTPLIARLNREGGDVGAAMTRLFRALAWVSVGFFGAAMLCGQEVMTVILGPGWALAGAMAVLVSPWLMANFVSSPLSVYGMVQNRLERQLAVSIAESALRLGGLFVGVWMHSVLLGIALYAVAGVAISVYSSWWVLGLAGVRLRDAIRPLLPTLAALAVGFAVVVYLRLSDAAPVVLLPTALTLSVGIALWCLWRATAVVRVVRAPQV